MTDTNRAISLSIRDTNGNSTQGDSLIVSEDQFEAALEMVESIADFSSSTTSISIQVNGNKVKFNPAHIVYAVVHTGTSHNELSMTDIEFDEAVASFKRGW